MSANLHIEILKSELYSESVDKALKKSADLHHALQERPAPVPIPRWRRWLLTNLVYMPLAGSLGGLAAWRIAEPFMAESDLAKKLNDWDFSGYLFIVLMPVFIVLALNLVEGIASRNWLTAGSRMAVGSVLTPVFAVLAMVPAGMVFLLLGFLLSGSSDAGLEQTTRLSPTTFILMVIVRGLCWGFLGIGAGLGMMLPKGTTTQLQNAVLGGMVGGVLGGTLFDPIDRFVSTNHDVAALSRAIGAATIGLSIGFFIALSDRLAREAWLRVRTGPLAGKSFVLHRSPTTIGSTPHADVYLFKDAGIEPRHAVIHQVGETYELEDLQSDTGTRVDGQLLRHLQRHRLSSGSQIQIGATVLEFEERARQRWGRGAAKQIGGA